MHGHLQKLQPGVGMEDASPRQDALLPEDGKKRDFVSMVDDEGMHGLRGTLHFTHFHQRKKQKVEGRETQNRSAVANALFVSELYCSERQPPLKVGIKL